MECWLSSGLPTFLPKNRRPNKIPNSIYSKFYSRNSFHGTKTSPRSSRINHTNINLVHYLSLHVLNQLLLCLLLLSGRRRRSTNKEKFVFLRCINEFDAARISINEACKELNIHDRQYRSWSKQKDVIAQRNPTAMSIDKAGHLPLISTRNSYCASFLKNENKELKLMFQ